MATLEARKPKDEVDNASAKSTHKNSSVVDDSATVSEDSLTGTVAVSRNDGIADTSGDIDVVAVGTTGTRGIAASEDDAEERPHDPDGQFDCLAVGNTAPDTNTYTLCDGQPVQSIELSALDGTSGDNCDGFDDLIVGADGDARNRESPGANFLMFGGNFFVAAAEIGTVGNDELIGATAADGLVSGTDNDTLRTMCSRPTRTRRFRATCSPTTATSTHR